MTDTNKIKIHVVGGQLSYVFPFMSFLNASLVDTPDEADILWFTGGEDVDPGMYGEVANRRTYYSVQRSYEEDQLIQWFPDKLKVGICRGIQQFNVSNGGKLVQHCSNHAGVSHLVKDEETQECFRVNSAHHQMIIPSEGCKVLLYSATEPCKIKLDGNDRPIQLDQDPESAWYPQLNAFGVQYHPEWLEPSTRAFTWFVDKVKHYYQLVNQQN